MNGEYIKPTQVWDRILAWHRTNIGEVLSSSRHRQIVACRRDLCGALRECSHPSYPEIARMMGRNSHSSAYERVQRFNQMPESHRAHVLAIARGESR